MSLIRIPKTFRPTLPIKLTRRIFTSTSHALRKYDILVPHLRRKPALDERSRILGKVVIELPLRIGLVDLLNEQCQVVVGADDSL